MTMQTCQLCGEYTHEQCLCDVHDEETPKASVPMRLDGTPVAEPCLSMLPVHTDTSVFPDGVFQVTVHPNQLESFRRHLGVLGVITTVTTHIDDNTVGVTVDFSERWLLRPASVKRG
jgi:hypothetical protein